MLNNNNRKLYSDEEVCQIRNYQERDLYEDILDLKNMALIENMKQRNLIDIDQHYKNQVDLYNKARGIGKGGPMSRKSGQTRSVNKQSDDNSQIFSSFHRDTNDPSPNKKPSSSMLHNINSLLVNSNKIHSAGGLSALSSSHSNNKNVFFGNLPPEMRGMSREQIMNSPIGQIY